MSGDGRALRLDDVGAASKEHEVYGLTRLVFGRLRIPFPGNFLFLKYLPPIKRWGPYRELSAREWEGILDMLEATGSRMTVGITAGWVERDGRVVPFPRKFRDEACVIREGVRRGLLEVANHGYTHCVLERAAFRPRLFAGNRQFHREFLEWLPEAMHREHLIRSQAILVDFFEEPVLTLVPPGNAFSRKTLDVAAGLGFRYLSCKDARRHGPANGMVLIDDEHVLAIHDRDLVLRGSGWLRNLLQRPTGPPYLTVRAVGERLSK